MNDDGKFPEGMNEEDFQKFIQKLEEVKHITLTKAESLFLSDSVTLLLENEVEQGKYQLPAKTLLPSGGVAVPLELIQRIGMALLQATDPNNHEGISTMAINISELFLLREVCQSFKAYGNEPVGYNLLRKIYVLMLESDLKERVDFERILGNVDLNAQFEQDRLKKNNIAEENNGTT
mgnify:FL=1|tara:strand:- start:2898 stop:3431 length:534 start_codon:yes stop_codon:yes gene_type:complete